MFDRYFSPFLKNVERIHFTSLDVYINYLRTVKSKIHKNYGETLGYVSLGITTIAQVIDVGGAEQMARDYADPMSRYLNGALPGAAVTIPIFDPAYVGAIKREEFIKGNGCTEYIFPVNVESPLTMYPMTKGWDEWKSFRALRLIEIDTDELSYLSYLDRIQFKNHHPSYAIFTLNVSGLLMQRAAYLRSLPDIDSDPLSIYEWIHRYVVFPCLVDDMLTHWLMINYDNLTRERAEQLGVVDLYSNNQTFATPGMYQTEAFDDIHRLITQNYNSSVSLNRVLSSMRLVDEPNVSTHTTMMKKNVVFPQLLQYRWGEFMRDYRFMSIALKCAIAAPKDPLSQSLGHNLHSVYQLYLQTRPWGVVDTTKARNLIEDRMSEIGRLIEILRSVTNKT